MTGFGLIIGAYILAEVYGTVHGYESYSWMSWRKIKDKTADKEEDENVKNDKS